VRVTAAAIEDDLARLARITGCVRTYSTRNGLDQIPEIAARHGLKVMQGIWLGGDPQAAARDIERAIALANRLPHVITALIVGNEVLLRGEMSAPDLINTIHRVKAAVRVPVTYADVWEFWLRYREVASAVDFVTIHILPYWEDFPIAADAAAAHVDSIRRRVVAAFPGKEVFLGEVGWPSAGRMREGALPSPANQARVIQEVLARAEQGSYRVNLIEAFDQPWKRRLEGTVGGHWGLLDGESRRFKFSLGEPVSNHPHWPLQAAGGVALAALTFAAAFVGARESKVVPLAAWVGVAVVALVAGILIGWTVANVPLESLGIGGWLRSLAFAALAFVAPVAGAAALTRGTRVPPLARVLGRAADRPRDALAVALGLILAALAVMAVQAALGLVFDPRYRDFPFAPLTAAAGPFVLLMLRTRGRGERGAAETAFAAVLAASAVYVFFNEGLANWQAVWLCLVWLALALTLFRLRDVRD
jgi:glucan 1,3-beta-glucosidase